MAFSTIPFTGPIVSDPTNFGWCSVSPTKAFIIFTGWTGATIGTGTRKLFIQAVYFNGKAAPTYGPACAVQNIAYAGALFPNIVALGDGRLLATVNETAAAFSYYVFDVNGSDQVSFSFKSGAPITPAWSNVGCYGVGLALLSGTKVLSGNQTSATSGAQTYQIVDVGVSGFTLTPVPVGSAWCIDRVDRQRKAHSYFQTQLFRRDRNGKLMAIRSLFAPSYVSGQNNIQPFGYAFASFDDQGVPQFYAGDDGMFAITAALGGHDDSGMQKARDMLPISPSTILSLGAVDNLGRGAALPKSNFVKLTIGKQESLETNQISASAETPWRDTGKIFFLDVIWLDTEYFFALARTATAVSDDVIVANTFQTTGTTNSRDQMVYIGKYNDTTGSITLGDASPLALPTRCSNTQPGGQYLHRISNVEVAILEVTQKDDVPTNNSWELNVIVIGA
jgi:hypothetical protein